MTMFCFFSIFIFRDFYSGRIVFLSVCACPCLSVPVCAFVCVCVCFRLCLCVFLVVCVSVRVCVFCCVGVSVFVVRVSFVRACGEV